MDIYIQTKNLLDDIGARYLNEYGGDEPLPPRGMVVQALNESNARVAVICNRYLVSDLQGQVSDDLGVDETLHYDFKFSPRRAMGKEQALADTIHSYLVHCVLAKVYSTSNLADLATKHNEAALVDEGMIDKLIHTKVAPR